MKLRAERTTLAAAAADAARALASKPVAPVMNGLMLTATEDGDVTLTGYDYDTLITATVSAEVLEPGRVLVPGRVFAAFLASMPDGPVELIDEGSRVRIVGKGCRYGLSTLDVEDYPALPTPPAVVGRVDASTLARVAPRASVSARPGDGKVWWHGVVHFEAMPDCLLMGASDGNSATRYSVPWSGPGPAEIVTGEMSGRVLADAVRGMAGEVSVCLDGAQIGLQCAGRSVTVRRIEDQYVNWRRVVETLPTPATVVRLDRDELLSAMQRAQQVLGGGAEPVRVRIGEGQVAYDVATASGGEVEGALDVTHHGGDDMELGMHPHLLADAVKAIGGDSVELSLAGPAKVIVVRDPKVDSGDLQLVMPKRLVTAR